MSEQTALESQTALEAARPTEITDRLRRVLDTRLHADGTLRKRIYKTSERVMERAILGDLYAILRRPIDADDLTVDVADLLVKRWKNAGLKAKSSRRRLEWFKTMNAVTVAMGLSKPMDYSGIEILRGYDWTKDRRAIPTPEAANKPGRPVTRKAKMTLLEILSKHYRLERLVGKSPNTTRLYQHSINALSKYLGRPAILADLNTQTVSDYISWALDKTQLARATVQKDRTQLIALWNYAAKKGWLSEFPQIPNVRVPDRVPDSWSDEELAALVAACKARREMFGAIRADKFWLTLLNVLWDTGERVGAILQTTHSSLDTEGRLTVKGEHRKGGKRDKRYRLQPATVAMIREIRCPDESLIFPWKYDYNYLWVKFGQVLEAAGLPNNRRTKFHKIRRSVASNFEAAGGNSTELLDHQNRSVTKRNYLNPDVLKTLQPADVLPAFGEAAPVNPAEPAAAAPADEAAALLAKMRELLGQAG